MCLLLLATFSIQAGATIAAWDASPDASVVGYMLYQGSASGSYSTKTDVGKVLAYDVPSLAAGNTYYFAVTAYNAARSESVFSNEASITLPGGAPVASFTASTQTGNAPLALNFTNSSTGTITAYAWTFGDGTTSSVQSPAHVYSLPGTYTVSLKVTGPGGTNTLTRSNYITATVGGSDATPPTIPTNVAAVTAGVGGIKLTWTASTDNKGVTGYRVERCVGASCGNFAQVATPSGTSFTDSGLANGVYYRYRVRAVDAAGNLSGYSSLVTIATVAAVLNIGETTILPTVGNQSNAMVYAQTASLGVSATVVSMSIYIDSATPTGSAMLGIYDATGATGGPGKRLAVTPSFKLVHGWNKANVVTAAVLPPGTYWLLLDNTDNPSFTIRSGSGGTSRFAGGFFALPSPMPAMPNKVAGHISLFATFAP